jgi:hypothetical protein
MGRNSERFHNESVLAGMHSRAERCWCAASLLLPFELKNEALPLQMRSSYPNLDGEVVFRYRLSGKAGA